MFWDVLLSPSISKIIIDIKIIGRNINEIAIC
jgi:hypothetical protein